MRRLLLALPLALLPLGAVQAGTKAHDHDHADHADHGASLDAHAHGAAHLDAVLEGRTLELALRSPAANLLGFEHAPRSAEEKARVSVARAQLQQPAALFGLGETGCAMTEQKLESPLFEAASHSHAHRHGQDNDQHSDIHAHYRFDCAGPDALQRLDLSALFRQFPAIETIQVQLIGPNGQRGVELSAGEPRLNF